MKHEESQVEKAVSAVLASPRVEDAARVCGISRTTLWRMMQDSEFQRRLQEARLNLSKEICTSLQANALDAVNTLRSIMLDKKTPASTRVAAAGKMIELSLRAREQLEVEERIAAVEYALNQRKEKRG